jgi:hypothetical protein
MKRQLPSREWLEKNLPSWKPRERKKAVENRPHRTKRRSKTLLVTVVVLLVVFLVFLRLSGVL